ncbi:MAG: heavy metal translocating P-type ATPase, partial [Clostridiales bacterium]|nr:heavy metal translocating P-type ATPase [Clostridiales bacterium]
TRIPLDGTVEKGESSADEAMLTGESLPVDKLPGSRVISGSVNQQGTLHVRVTHVGEETTLSRIIRFVQQAQERKAPIAGLADRVAGIFVPAVIIIALLASAAWLIAGKDLSFAVRILTAVLVIACPCAMGLATPTAIVVGTGLGASRGILIRNGEALETTHGAQVVIFDKTGTLTQGRPSLADTIALQGDADALTSLAALAEEASQHPLAEAFTRRAKKLGARPRGLQVTRFENVTGRGIRATFSDGRTMVLGNAAFMEEMGMDPAPLSAKAQAFAGLGHTAIYAALDGQLAGLFSVADQVKPNAALAVQELKDMGIRTLLLTGDGQAAARAIGSQVGVDEVIASVLPEGKAAVVERFRQQGYTVLMVGDGINDSPALAAADVGCAIGNGSDIAMEVADLVLMKSDVQDVPRAIRLSRLTIRNIKQNLFWAFFYNIIGIPVAAGLLYLLGGPLMNPMLAGLAMSLSSICVVGNALRLRRAKL